MEKRISRRIPVKRLLRFPCCNTYHSGTVTNLSENGMFIHTMMCFPVQSKLELSIPLENEILKVPVKVNRIVKAGNVYDGMGVELMNLTKKYLKFIIKLNIVCKN
ncbi:MAG: PilZ domain-containing protein [Candidatus Mariimomonas ferrooxydans]